MFLTFMKKKKKKKKEVTNHFRPNEETTHVKGVLCYISITSV